VTIRHDYLMLVLAVTLLVTNCLGAAFTIKQNYLRTKQVREHGEGTFSQVTFGWAGIYGRFAVAQRILVVLAMVATVIIVVHENSVGFAVVAMPINILHSLFESIQSISMKF